MDLSWSEEDERFRAELRAWIEEALPELPPEPKREDWQARRERDTTWQRMLYDAGYAGINWPSEFGGRGASLSEQLVFYEEITNAGMRGKVAPDRPERRHRSTRRRQDAPDLPRRKVSPRTVGKTYTAPDGKTFRPSLFVTLTCPSYGRVGEDGAPAARPPRHPRHHRPCRAASRAGRHLPPGLVA